MISNHNIENLIVLKASNLFANCGIKSVCMNDIASSCKISKKTIYKHFETKEILLQKIASTIFTENTIGFNRLTHTENIFESIECVFEAVEKIYTVISPKFIVETKTNYKNLYDFITNLELINLKNILKKIICTGRSQGIFNSIQDPDFLIESYFNFLHNLVNDANKSFNTLNQIKCINNYFLYSLLSLKGLQNQIEIFKNSGNIIKQ